MQMTRTPIQSNSFRDSTASMHPATANFHLPPPHHHQRTEFQPARHVFLKMPRVVKNQKEKFDSDDFMKKHTRDSEVPA